VHAVVLCRHTQGSGGGRNRPNSGGHMALQRSPSMAAPTVALPPGFQVLLTTFVLRISTLLVGTLQQVALRTCPVLPGASREAGMQQCHLSSLSNLVSAELSSCVPRLQAISVGVGFACFAAAAVVTGALIPASMRPRFAWPLASEWLVFTFCMLLAAWFTVGGLQLATVWHAECMPTTFSMPTTSGFHALLQRVTSMHIPDSQTHCMSSPVHAP
jgi:hypothetical protein